MLVVSIILEAAVAVFAALAEPVKRDQLLPCVVLGETATHKIIV
jgi:hypothetical protein